MYKNTNNFNRKKARAKEEKGLHFTATGKDFIQDGKMFTVQSNVRRVIKNTIGGNTSDIKQTSLTSFRCKDQTPKTSMKSRQENLLLA